MRRLTKEDKKYIEENYATIPYDEIAKTLGCHPHTVTYHVYKNNNGRKHKAWSREECETITAMAAEGKTVQEIARSLGRSDIQVYVKIFKMRKAGQEIIVARKPRARRMCVNSKDVMECFSNTLEKFGVDASDSMKNHFARSLKANQVTSV